ncbi:MAG TPA: SPASM domain-containing protein, partial [Candidatus Omnitrophota bacterium]|nr:SPASM domain-containing protein [Candidatus Omnitrophota bacterium]
VLNADRLTRLFEAGLSTLLISVYDSKEDADRLGALCADAGLRPDQYVIRHRYLPPEEDFGITLSNRAGMMDAAEFKLPTPAEPLTAPCYYPHYTFFMDYLGDVLLCPHDWGKKRVVGNLRDQDFLDIWTGEAFSAARRRLAAGDRAFAPCGGCDVKGALMGAKHSQLWVQLEAAKRGG